MGVVTDRDIVCRIVAKGINPIAVKASECMSRPVITVRPDSSIETAARLLEEHQVRRLPVVDNEGICRGMLSQADLATKGPRKKVTEVMERISEPRTGPGAYSSASL